MSIDDRKFKRLTAENVSRAPKKPGVYGLYAGRTLVYLGSAGGDDTLRTALQGHVGAPPSKATRYKREASKKPEARLKTLLAEHQAEHGRWPDGNGNGNGNGNGGRSR
jgi:hypothetical protein